MALLYFRDAEKANESGKVWMGKSTVRVLLEKRDEKLKHAAALHADALLAIEVYQGLISKMTVKNEKLKLYLGVSIGVNILSAIIWCGSHLT